MIEEKVTEIFRDIFDNPELTITQTTNAKDIKAWDSLANINLIVAMEKEFKIKFNIQEIKQLKNVGGMIELIKKLVSKT